MEKTTEISADLNTFISAIKRGYLAHNAIASNFHEPMPIEAGGYVRLALVNAQEQLDKERKVFGREEIDKENPSKSKRLFEDQRLTSFEQIYGVKQVIELEDIFNQDVNNRGSSQLHRLLILGRAGIGKSTLCQYMAYSWAKSEKNLWRDKYKLLLWIPLRKIVDIPAKNANIFQVIWDLCVPDDGWGQKIYDLETTKRCLRSLGIDNILFVLDGYDEVAEKVEETGEGTAQGELLRFLLSQNNVIITSRPYRIDGYLSAETAKPIDRKFENMGFLDENIDQYITAFFSKQSKKEEYIGALREFLSQNANVRGIAHIPINLSLLCSGWLRGLGKLYTDKQGEITVTRLYQGLLVDLCWRYLKKQKISLSVIDPIEILKSSHSKPIITFLGELAFLQMNQESLYIPYQSITALAKKYKLTKEELDSRLDFGLVQCYGQQQDPNRSYYFIHLTFQEFLAGYYIAEQLSEDQGQMHEGSREIESCIQMHKYSREHEIMWWFVAGTLSDRREVLERFFGLLASPPHDHGRLYHQMLLLRCMDECQLKVSPERRRDFLEKLIEWIKLSKGKENISSITVSYLSLSQTVFQQQEIKEFFISSLKSQDTALAADVIRFFNIKSPLPLYIQEEFVRLLQDENRNVRYWAASALGKQSSLPSPILEQLVRLLRDENRNVRSPAVRALGKQSSLSSPILEQLVRLLQDEDDFVRSSAAEALGSQSSLSSPILEQLVRLLQDEDDFVRSLTAAEALGKQSSLSSPILEQLVRLLQDEKSHVRYSAASVLGKQSSLSSPILEQLVRLLQNEKSHVRSSAVRALGKQSSLSSPILEQLVRLLQDEGTYVRALAGQALRNQSSFPSPILEQLVRLLQDEKIDVRYSAASVLGNQSSLPSPILEQLVRLLRDENRNVRSSAVRAFGKQSSLSSPILEQLVRLLQNEKSHVRSSAASALGNQSLLSSPILEQLVRLLQDEDSDVRSSAAEALGSQSSLSSPILEQLVRLLQDEDSDVRSSAVRALGKQSSLSSPILEQLVRLLQDEKSDVRASAAEVLGSQSSLPSPILEELVSLLQDEDSDVRYRAASVLGKQSSLPYPILEQLGNLFCQKDINRNFLALTIKNLPINILLTEIDKQGDHRSINPLVLLVIKVLDQKLSVYRLGKIIYFGLTKQKIDNFESEDKAKDFLAAFDKAFYMVLDITPTIEIETINLISADEQAALAQSGDSAINPSKDRKMKPQFELNAPSRIDVSTVPRFEEKIQERVSAGPVESDLDFNTLAIEKIFKGQLRSLKKALKRIKSPSMFLIYAHEPKEKSLGKADVDVAQMIMRWLHDDLGLALYGDRDPHRVDDTILQSQLSLIRGNAYSVDKIIICGSVVLKQYENNIYQKYKLKIYDTVNRNQPKTIREYETYVGNQLVQLKREHGAELHHLMTELALVSLRLDGNTEEPANKLVIPLLLNGEQETALPTFVTHSQRYIGKTRYRNAGEWQNKKTLKNQGLHEGFFELLEFIFADNKVILGAISGIKKAYQNAVEIIANDQLPKETKQQQLEQLIAKAQKEKTQKLDEYSKFFNSGLESSSSSNEDSRDSLTESNEIQKLPGVNS